MPQAVLSRALVQCAKLILCCVLHSPLPVSWKFQLSLAHFKSIASPPLLWRSTPTVTCLLALVLSNLSSAVNCRFLTSYRVCFSILPPPCSGNSNHHLLVWNWACFCSLSSLKIAVETPVVAYSLDADTCSPSCDVIFFLFFLQFCTLFDL